MKTGRRTVAAAAFVAAVGLSVLNAPTAQAADTGIIVSDLVINDNGKSIVVGTTKRVYPTFTFNLTLPAGYSTADPFRYDVFVYLYHGDLKGKAVKDGENIIPPGGTTCYERDAKHARCEGELFIDPHPTKYSVDSNSDATTWKTAIGLTLFTRDDQLKTHETETRPYTVQLKRAARTTTNATPEPVSKGKKVTVTGKVTRANWSTKKYDAYSGRTVSLQFRAKGAKTYKTLKKATSNGTGNLKTTVTAGVDGYYRWVYYGNSTTGSATSTADYVDVR
ncbi:hypothetical protein [Streptomyces sp. AM 3-1-1]|uniref:hypothetical protein n=1 Tax=Streptomyces sp. AM 3-1-1 TaxID=3028711 RepID=UPI0023BA2802|nr:hypothetical protein [Streptomyces sp. AM 3-1-1]WEH29240.1 hypothetical protein P0D76_19010 [Streptomyces sp. AM 3-1-1]